MSRNLTLSDELYARLEAEARNRGLDSITKLLAEMGATEPRRDRREAIRRIDALREQLRTTHGELPDSTELLRADRQR